MRQLRTLTWLVAVTLRTSLVRACTVCSSVNGHRLRAGLFDGHFLHTALLVAAPLPVLVLAALLVHLAAPAMLGAGTQPCADLRAIEPMAPERAA